MSDLKKRCQEYLASRTSDYTFRCMRYQAVADKLCHLGLELKDTVYDIGAGRQEFGKFLRTYAGWKGLYIPVDGSIDGTDLNDWSPPFKAEYLIAIEVIEHIHDPIGLCLSMESSALKGVVVTTPNPRVVDVIGCDPTHVSVIPASHFNEIGWESEERNLFMKPSDTLLAWKDKR